ncbi:hypothetical protein [Pseudomonas lini]
MGAIQENEKHRVEYSALEIQFDKGGETVDGFSEIHELGVEVNVFDFGVGTHQDVLAPERVRERNIGHQVWALNVGFVVRIHFGGYHRPKHWIRKV